MKKTYIFLASSFIASLMISNVVVAQYIWLNDKGVKQYSDTPPPKSVPREKILKSPFGTTRPTTAIEAKNPADAVAENPKIEKPVTTASKNEDFNKRKLAREEADKKIAAEKQQNSDKAKNCERAKSYKQSLDEGMLIMSRDKNGERAPLDEAQRAREMNDVKKVLADCR
jgi:hypothetical protein